MMNIEGGPYGLGFNDGRNKFSSKMTNGSRKVRACTMISFHFYISADLEGCTDYH